MRFSVKLPTFIEDGFSAMYLAVMLGLVPVGQLILGLSAKFFGAELAVRGCSIIAMVINGPVRLFVL